MCLFLLKFRKVHFFYFPNEVGTNERGKGVGACGLVEGLLEHLVLAALVDATDGEVGGTVVALHVILSVSHSPGGETRDE